MGDITCIIGLCKSIFNEGIAGCNRVKVRGIDYEHWWTNSVESWTMLELITSS